MPLPQGILDDALAAVGHTPLVRLDRIAREEGLKCNLLGKAEFMSIGGSVKDRIAKLMVEEAEKDGKLVPGVTTVIEATSGNAGIGLGLACAIKGYPLIITLPAKMSLEKEVTMQALGAEIVRTPTKAKWDSDESHIGVAKRLHANIPNSVMLNQYSNIYNPLAHELTTGPEIIDAILADHAASTPNSKPSSGKVDAIFIGTGTGGTVTGVSRAMKRHNPDCVIVGVDPKGSILASPDSLNVLEPGASGSYQVEGIGHDFFPAVLDRTSVDSWVKVGDDEAFPATLRLIRTEGLLVGGSCGSALAAALKWLKGDGWRDFGSVEGKNVVLILPDGIRNYMSKPWFIKEARPSVDSPLSKVVRNALGRCDSKAVPEASNH